MLNLAELRDAGAGRDLVVLGGGPSLREVDTARLRAVPHVHTLAINTPDPRCFPADYWMLLDRDQWEAHRDLIPAHPGPLLCGVRGRLDGLPVTGRTVRLPLRGVGDWARNPPFHLGRSSAYVAAQLGLYLGYERVYLLGVDMTLVGGRTHFYESGCDPGTRARAFEEDARCWDRAARSAPRADRERVWFCSSYIPWSFPLHFRRVAQTRALRLIESRSDVDRL